jgi:hypothetical protein
MDAESIADSKMNAIAAHPFGGVTTDGIAGK